MNRTIKDATVKRYYYETHDQLRTHLRDCVDAYNLARHLKTLRAHPIRIRLQSPNFTASSGWNVETMVDISKAEQGPVGLSTSSVLSIVCGQERSGTIGNSIGFAPDDTRSCHSGPVNGPFQVTGAGDGRQTATASLGDKKERRLQTATVLERGDAQ